MKNSKIFMAFFICGHIGNTYKSRLSPSLKILNFPVESLLLPVTTFPRTAAKDSWEGFRYTEPQARGATIVFFGNHGPDAGCRTDQYGMVPRIAAADHLERTGINSIHPGERTRQGIQCRFCGIG